MSSGFPDDRLDAALDRFLAERASETASMPSPADIVDQIRGLPTRRVGMGPIVRSAWVVLALLALLAVLSVAALIGGALPDRQPLGGIPSNGWIAVSANPVGVGGGKAGDVYLLTNGVPARLLIGSPNDGIAQACPAFSPDGRQLAYGEARASDRPVTTFRGNWPVTERAVVVVDIDAQGNASSPSLGSPRLLPQGGFRAGGPGRPIRGLSARV